MTDNEKIAQIMEKDNTPTVSAPAPTVPKLEPTKRRLDNIFCEDLPDTKKLLQNEVLDNKSKAIRLLLHWHEYLVRVFEIEFVNRIDTVAYLTSMLWLMHRKMKQDAIKSGNLYTKITDTFKFECNGRSITWGETKDVISKIAGLYGFRYDTTRAGKDATEALESVLTLIYVYKQKFKEVVVGTNQIELEGANGKARKVPIQYFGLDAEHVVLMTGCTYNRVFQPVMKTNLGCMTIAINLAMQTDGTQHDIWNKLFIRIFNNFPNVKEIADLIAGSRYNNTIILKYLADISLWGAARSTNKPAFPFSFFLCVARQIEAYQKFFAKKIPNIPIPEDVVHPAIKAMDFERHKAFLFWNAALAASSYTIRAPPEMTQRTMRELVFHAVWGTQNENLNLLEWMTQHTFQTRHEMGDQLFKSGERQEEQLFHLIPFIKESQLSKVLHPNGYPPIPMVSVFSCRRIYTFPYDFELYDSLIQNREEFIPFLDLKPKIISKLARVKASIAERSRPMQSFAFDSLKFREFDPENCYGPVATAPQLQEKFFYTQDD